MYFNTWNIFCCIFKFFFVTYLFQSFFKSCNIKKKIKVNKKKKVVYTPKITLAITYFVLISLLMYFFTLKVILFTFVGITIGILILCEKFFPNIINYINKIDKHLSIIIIVWKIFKTTFTIIYLFTDPLNNFLNNFITKKINIVKRMFNLMNNLESSDTKDTDIINNKLLNKKENNNSGISEYIIKSKKEKKIEKKQKQNDEEYEKDDEEDMSSIQEDTSSNQEDTSSNQEEKSYESKFNKLTKDTHNNQEEKSYESEINRLNKEIKDLINETLEDKSSEDKSSEDKSLEDKSSNSNNNNDNKSNENNSSTNSKSIKEDIMIKVNNLKKIFNNDNESEFDEIQETLTE